jgi:hypothetical protein
MLKDNIFNFAIIDVNIDNGVGFEIAEYIKSNNIQCHLIAQSIIPSKEEREKSVMKKVLKIILKNLLQRKI